MQTFMAILAVVIVVVYAVIAGLWVETGSAWYRSLKRPFWQPPDFVFGVIWPYNFFILALASVQVCLNSSKEAALMWIFTLSLSVIFASAWSADFYKNRELARSAIWLGAATLTTVGLMVQLHAIYPSLVVWVLPYQIWLWLAFSLAAGYAYLNPK